MTDLQIFGSVASAAAGVVVATGALVRKFTNGDSNGSKLSAKTQSDILTELKDINKNTVALPEVVREWREYMIEGRKAMGQIDRIDRISYDVATQGERRSAPR